MAAKKTKKSKNFKSYLIIGTILIVGVVSALLVQAGALPTFFQPASINEIIEKDPNEAKTAAEKKIINKVNTAANKEAKAKTAKQKEKAVGELLVSSTAFDDIQKNKDKTAEQALEEAKVKLLSNNTINTDGTLGDNKDNDSIKAQIAKEYAGAAAKYGSADGSSDSDICGKANVPLKKGYTYATGYGLKEDGSKCTGGDNSCKLRECVTYGDDCKAKTVVCGDAYADNPLKVVLPTGGGCNQYTTGSGKDAKCINAPAPCHTDGGPVPTGNKNDKDEYCFNGRWIEKGKDPAKEVGNAFCGSGMEWDTDNAKCKTQSPAATTIDLKKAVGDDIYNKCSTLGKGEGGCSSQEVCYNMSGSSSPDNKRYECRLINEVVSQSHSSSCIGNVLSSWNKDTLTFTKSYCSAGCDSSTKKCYTSNLRDIEAVKLYETDKCNGKCNCKSQGPEIGSSKINHYYCEEDLINYRKKACENSGFGYKWDESAKSCELVKTNTAFDQPGIVVNSLASRAVSSCSQCNGDIGEICKPSTKGPICVNENLTKPKWDLRVPEGEPGSLVSDPSLCEVASIRSTTVVGKYQCLSESQKELNEKVNAAIVNFLFKKPGDPGSLVSDPSTCTIGSIKSTAAAGKYQCLSEAGLANQQKVDNFIQETLNKIFKKPGEPGTTVKDPSLCTVGSVKSVTSPGLYQCLSESQKELNEKVNAAIEKLISAPKVRSVASCEECNSGEGCVLGGLTLYQCISDQ